MNIDFLNIKFVKIQVLCLTAFLLFTFSCSNLNMYEIKKMAKVTAEELKLKPASNYNELRIDVIRNITTYQTGRYTTVTELVPYHKLGFDMGNGLFYDLNGNLCLLIEHIFGISPYTDFSIEENINPSNDRNNRLYTYANDCLVMTNLNSGKEKLLYTMEKDNDTLFFNTEKGKRYTFVETDTSLIYQWKNQKPTKILEVEDGVFKINRSNAKLDYKIIDEGVVLANTYFICTSYDANSIEVYHSKKGKKGKLLMSIVKGKESMYIYDRKARGTKVEMKDNRLLVIKPGSKTMTSYELKQKSQI